MKPQTLVRLALATAALVTLGSAPLARAEESDQMITVGAPESMDAQQLESFALKQSHLTKVGGGCGPFDPTCSVRLNKILSSLHLGSPKLSGGVRFGDKGAKAAIKFHIDGASWETPMGDVEAVMFDAVYLPDAGGVRIRFTLAKTDVLFFCKDSDGKTQPPLIGIANCQIERGSMIGVGGQLVQISGDTATGRVAARWADLNMVLNILRNGGTFDYMKHRLNAFAGASVDSVFYGDVPGHNGGSGHFVRGNVGISGMLRSADNHWELRGIAAYRPNVTAWNDYSIELRTQILYHLLLSDTVLADIGLDASASRNSIPARSMDLMASEREMNSAYLGAMFGVQF